MSTESLRIVWIYPDLLSTYGDRGNMLILARRAQLRPVHEPPTPSQTLPSRPADTSRPPAVTSR